MASAVGSFTTNTSTGNQSVTGVGFQPDVVILLATKETSVGAAANDASISFGCIDRGAEQWSQAYFEDDGTLETSHYLAAGNQCLTIIESDTTTARASYVSIDSNGFTINWDTAPSSAYLVFYLAFTVEQVRIGSATLTGSSDDVVTNETSAYTPDFVLFSIADQVTNLAAHADLSVGWAKSTTSRGVAQARASDNQVGGRLDSSILRTDAVLSHTDTVTHVAGGSLFDVSAFNSDGFTITRDTGTDGTRYAWLACKVPFAASGLDTQKTSTGTRSVTGLGFEPDAVVFASIGATSSSSGDATMTIGMVASNGERCAWVGGEEGSNPAAVGSAIKDSKALVFIDTPGTVVAEADCTLDSDGFTLDWTTADGTAREFLYLAFQTYGFTPADAFVPQIYRLIR